MMTKERILELLGNAPEKLERWEQQIIIFKNSPISAYYCRELLNRHKIPYKKKEHFFHMTEEDLSKRKKGMDKDTIIALARKYQACPSSIVGNLKANGRRKMPSKEKVIAFYTNWIQTKGNSTGWINGFLKEYNISSHDSVRKFLKSRKIILPSTNLWDFKKREYLKELISDIKQEDIYTQTKNCNTYIAEKFCERFPMYTKKAVIAKVQILYKQLPTEILELKRNFVQKLLDNRDISISVTETAKIWAQKYPMFGEHTYSRYMAAGSTSRYVEKQKRANTKYAITTKETFLNNLPNSLTEEQKKQIIEAYEKASY